MARIRRFSRSVLAAILAGVMLACVVGASLIRGVMWSDGAGNLWGVSNGAWVTLRLMPQSPKPGAGLHLAPTSGTTRGIVLGGVVCLPQTRSATTLDLWLAIPPSLGIGVLTFLAWRDRVRRAGECKSCGYERRGLREGAACPECGRLPDATPAPVPHT